MSLRQGRRARLLRARATTDTNRERAHTQDHHRVATATLVVVETAIETNGRHRQGIRREAIADVKSRFRAGSPRAASTCRFDRLRRARSAAEVAAHLTAETSISVPPPERRRRRIATRAQRFVVGAWLSMYDSPNPTAREGQPVMYDPDDGLTTGPSCVTWCAADVA